jgi:hypothetical protein
MGRRGLVRPTQGRLVRLFLQSFVSFRLYLEFGLRTELDRLRCFHRDETLRLVVDGSRFVKDDAWQTGEELENGTNFQRHGKTKSCVGSRRDRKIAADTGCLSFGSYCFLAFASSCSRELSMHFIGSFGALVSCLRQNSRVKQKELVR